MRIYSFFAKSDAQQHKLVFFFTQWKKRSASALLVHSPHLTANRASFSTFIEFAIIKSLQFPVLCVCLTERGRDGDWETLDRGNSINCGFLWERLQLLSPCLISCLPGSCSINSYLWSHVTKTWDTQRPAHIHKCTHAHEISWWSDRKRWREMCYQTLHIRMWVKDLAASLSLSVITLRLSLHSNWEANITVLHICHCRIQIKLPSGCVSAS